jgi:hypothetical protein
VIDTEPKSVSVVMNPVRIQMGRLRQRLAEYYRTEGKNQSEMHPSRYYTPLERRRLLFCLVDC